jgi:hypothetical protein
VEYTLARHDELGGSALFISIPITLAGLPAIRQQEEEKRKEERKTKSTTDLELQISTDETTQRGENFKATKQDRNKPILS